MEVEKYTVTLPKIKKDFRLAVLSDLHLREGSFKNHLEPVLDIVKKMKPTYIILVGDYVAGHKAYNNFLNNEAQERFWRYLNELNKIAPIVMSLGNHDVSQGMDKELRKEFFKFERKDIHPVDREKSYYDKNLNINFLGYMQPHDVYSICDMSKKKRKAVLADIKKYMPKAIKKDVCNIGLIHTPYVVRDKYLLANDSPTQNLDLILSGHHHGGLINYKTIKRIEKTNDFLIKLFPKYKEAIKKMRYFGLCENPLNHPLPFINPYARGMHTFGGVPTIISRGVGNESASGINRKNPKNQFVTQVDVIAKIKNNI